MKLEYKVVPAPERASKKRGLKGAALFAHSVEALMNELAADGWHYLRADTLPQEERSGLTTKTTTYRNLLVFQRVVADETNTATEPQAQTEAPDAEAAPAPKSKAKSRPDGASPDEDEVTNLWQATDPVETGKLVADRQS